MMSRAYDGAAPMIAAIWIGLILGVSFYAAPIKFTAAGVTTEQLLAVGKVTFQGFAWIELCAFILLVLASLNRMSRTVVTGIMVLGALLLVQKFGILPGLDNELDQTVAGANVDDTNLHFLYVAVECVKLAVLFFLAPNLRRAHTAA